MHPGNSKVHKQVTSGSWSNMGMLQAAHILVLGVCMDGCAMIHRCGCAATCDVGRVGLPRVPNWASAATFVRPYVVGAVNLIADTIALQLMMQVVQGMTLAQRIELL